MLFYCQYRVFDGGNIWYNLTMVPEVPVAKTRVSVSKARPVSKTRPVSKATVSKTRPDARVSIANVVIAKARVSSAAVSKARVSIGAVVRIGLSLGICGPLGNVDSTDGVSPIVSGGSIAIWLVLADGGWGAIATDGDGSTSGWGSIGAGVSSIAIGSVSSVSSIAKAAVAIAMASMVAAIVGVSLSLTLGDVDSSDRVSDIVSRGGIAIGTVDTNCLQTISTIAISTMSTISCIAISTVSSIAKAAVAIAMASIAIGAVERISLCSN